MPLPDRAAGHPPLLHPDFIDASPNSLKPDLPARDFYFSPAMPINFLCLPSSISFKSKSINSTESRISSVILSQAIHSRRFFVPFQRVASSCICIYVQPRCAPISLGQNEDICKMAEQRTEDRLAEVAWRDSARVVRMPTERHL